MGAICQIFGRPCYRLKRTGMTPHAPVTLPEFSLRDRVQSFLASGLLAAALPFLAIYYLVSRGRSQSSRRYLRERLGNLPSNLCQAAPGAIWVHAVSVGEALAIGPLLPKLRQRFLGRRILVSTTTVTGQALAAQQLDCDGAFYFPLDFAFACRRALRAIQPALVVIAETEFWPRFLREARLAGARVVVVNGRISDRSFGRYHFWRNSMRPVLAHVDRFLMQSQEDARRVRAIGAPAERVFVTGNLKYDLALPTPSPVVTWLEGELSRRPRRPVLVAGSVTAGEESLVLIAFGIVQGQWPQALLVLAPRKPERFDTAARLIEESHRKVVRRSGLRLEGASGAALDEAASVLLLDSVGELPGVYRLADAVFVGGSLVPAGGHNILEPAAFGKPPLFGPSMENFRESTAMFLKAGAGIQVNSPEDLGVAWIELIQDGVRREQMGRAARELVERNRGAAERTLEHVAAVLDATGSDP